MCEESLFQKEVCVHGDVAGGNVFGVANSFDNRKDSIWDFAVVSADHEGEEIKISVSFLLTLGFSSN